MNHYYEIELLKGPIYYGSCRGDSTGVRIEVGHSDNNYNELEIRWNGSMWEVMSRDAPVVINYESK